MCSSRPSSDVTPSYWHLLPDSNCGNELQSPVNIEKKSVVVDEHLESFTFTNFDDKHAMESIMNTGHTGPAFKSHLWIDLECVF